MDPIAARFGVDELLGAVVVDHQWHLFKAHLWMWIMDHISYDPTTVDFQHSAWLAEGAGPSLFLVAMKPFALNDEEVSFLRQTHGLRNPLQFVIDFDRRLYVNGFHEVPTEEYVPKGWQGFEGEPLDFVPPDLASMWRR